MADANTTLPRPLTSFVGRQRELAQAKQLLADTRLLTLTGAGGSGKTRLCIQLADDVAAAFPDGACFVPLAPIRDPGLVLSSIARTLGLQDSRERPLIEHLASYLDKKAALLVLDNFEQLLVAAPIIGELLKETTALKVIVTSRACLRISGEQEYPVPPMTMPDASGRASAVAECESVRLFVERARASQPDFVVNERNAGAIAQIVSRLDGLPLAIELAAARVKLLPPAAMLPRLENSLGLLVAGPRDLPDRQQTLRSTIAWSYGLLSPSAQRLLAACSVFRGGGDLERIEQVCQSMLGSADAVLAGLEELADHSLLRRVETDGSPRFAMLETIREYAAERLAEAPEETQVRERHAAEFLNFAEEGERGLGGPQEKEWLERIELEHNNIRAASDWYARNTPPLALQLAVAMRAFWSARGHFTEGRHRLRSLLERVPDHTPARVRALNCAGWLAVDQGDYADAEARLREGIDLARELGDRYGEGVALAHLARCKIASAHPEEAERYLEQGLPILREVASPADLAIGLLYWGLWAIFIGQPALACERMESSVQMYRQIGFRSLRARALMLLANARSDLGDLGGARTALQEALPISIELEDHWVIPLHIGTFAGLAMLTGRPQQAVRLAGFADAYAHTHDFSIPEVMRRRIESWLASARASVRLSAATLYDEGRQMRLDEVVASVLAREPTQAQPSGQRGPLTARELEVARLVASGLTNRDIANQLFLSVRTVDVHVDHILTKLGFTTRTQVAGWIYELQNR